MSNGYRLHRTGLGVAAAVLIGSAAVAKAETRALNLYNTHTQERATIVFKRDGSYDQAGLQELNRLLRDWRRNESTKMDPQLFDLIWEVYRDTGARDPIHIVCGYRSPTTNNMLRSRSRGVAKFSQHTLGKAMDFYLPDVPLDKLRAVGMRKQFGGVGFYPTSGSPFVHMDTGSVRAWPRMTREQLVALFPDGKTAHLPADGNPLPRYSEALAEVQSRKGRGETAVASAGGSGGRSFLASFFGGGNKAAEAGDDDEEGAAPARVQTLRQGPPPPGSRAVADAGESYSPSTAPKPGAAGTAGSAAPGSLVALPLPVPAPRAPGSLVASNQGPNGTPAGWMQGPSGIVPAPAAAGTAQSVDMPVPAPKPGTQLAAAAPTIGTPLPAGYAQPRGKPGTSYAALPPSAAPASQAIAMATGAQDPVIAASALGYAPILPTPKPAYEPMPVAEIRSGGTGSSVQATAFGQSTAPRPQAGGGVVLAALPAATTGAVSATDAGTARLALPSTPAARPAAKGDRADPLARLVGRTGERTEPKLLDSATTRMAAFSELRHPDQEHLPQLLTKPALLVVSHFGNGSGELRSDRFSGPAVAALAIVKTD
ncbi:hypothetical protein ABB55_08265 [Prosthecomicrobium hirschii]|uniref:Murein endopeptidase K n=1 Tax=Prosthecodimorpha hirschii TaxID=665126 RepID=A0A0P6VJ13_9HYPH|nr:DUF882 domain-containing protein [Prosthecomicrobium hirschii]KPL52227.1 hypothetical protein ABB55_08265 [Prosthecomicrobium hirschii]